MINGFKPGDTVKVWPRPGLRVQAHAGIYNRFVSDEGETLTWNEWVHCRVMDGSLLLTDPHPAKAPIAKKDNE